MSHFTVLVITDEKPSDDHLAAVLQPWHEYECTGIDDEYVIDIDITDELVADYANHGEGRPFDEFVEDWTSATKREDGRWYRRTNPNAKWDWWQVGGRWSGHLRLKPGAQPILGRRGLMGPHSSDHPLAADQAMLGDVDLYTMREEARAKALVLWDEVHEAVHGLPAIEEWADVRERHVPDIGAARTEYHAQPGMVALKARFKDQWDHDNEVDATRRSREEYGQRAADKALTTFAVVKDGQWFERGKMGWWACVADEKEQAEWSAEFAKLLDDLPATAWLTVVDCHI